MILLDLDNCISNDGWRIPVIGLQRDDRTVRDKYHLYHSLALWDEPGNEALMFAEEPTAILTSRPVLYRDMTLEWLRRNRVNFAHLLMRNKDDMRSSVAVKREQLCWLINYYDVSLFDITAAYDDRPEIVEMYREFGIQSEVRAIHSIPYPS